MKNVLTKLLDNSFWSKLFWTKGWFQFLVLFGAPVLAFLIVAWAYMIPIM